MNLPLRIQFKAVIGVHKYTVHCLQHYKDEKDCHRYELIAVVSDYESLDTYIILVFLKTLSDEFKKLHSGTVITKKYLVEVMELLCDFDIRNLAGF